MSRVARPEQIAVASPSLMIEPNLARRSNDKSMDTHSLTSSVTDYPKFWGRRYHRYKEGSYLFPNDEDEQQRLDFQHSIFQKILDHRFYSSPLDPKAVRKVLDIGTGTGIWPMELADSNVLPDAEITGIDLSAIQPTEVHGNVIFEIQDCSEQDWARPSSSMDFIHIRGLAGSLTSYESLLKNARRYLKPGTGWIECHEIHPQPICDDNTMPPGWKMAEWEHHMARASKKLDPPRPIRIAGDLKQWLENAGYVDVQEQIYKIPFGPWPRDACLREIGQCWRDNWVSGLSGFSYKMLHYGLGWNRNEIEVELAAVRKAALQREVHSYMRLYVVYGRRPPREESGRRLRG